MEYFALEFFTHTFYIFFFCVCKNMKCSYAAPSRLSARCRSFAKYRFSCKHEICAWLTYAKKEYRLLGTQKNHIY